MLRGWLVRWGYYVRKYTPPTPNELSFRQYKKDLRSARRRVHLEAVEYQNAIEDEYLRRHQALMEQKHRERQGSFRKACFMNSYQLWKDADKIRRDNQKWEDKVGQALQGEEVRRINRSRILKIMEHESTHYWFNADNVDERLGEETIFPEYVASTEYYYKLFAEALAYEVGDFEELHMVTSNEEIIKEKNKRLIPLYLDLRGQIAEYKRDPIKEEHERHASTLERIQSIKSSPEERESRVSAEKERHEQRLKEEEGKLAKGISGMKQKMAAVVNILKTWKEYTNVLSLTSAQILHNQHGAEEEVAIRKTQGQVETELKNRQGQGFMDSIEEDTEEQEVPFEEFRDKARAARKETELAGQESIGVEQLNRLMAELRESQPINADQNSQTGPQQQKIDLGPVLQSSSVQDEPEEVKLDVEVDPEYLNPRETTASVEILKEALKGDPEAQKLLDQLGEIDVRYPKLLKSIWSTVHS